MNNFKIEDLRAIETYVRRYVDDLPIMIDNFNNRNKILSGMVSEADKAQVELRLNIPSSLHLNINMNLCEGSYRCTFSWDIM